MRIDKSKVVLDSQYRNVLAREFSKNYPSLNKLANPADIAQVMADVFDLTNQAEE